MDPYTKEITPGAGGYTPSPAPQVKPRRYRRSLAEVFRTSRRFRYLVCAGIIVVGAVSVPAISHLLSKPAPRVLEATRALPAGHVIVPGDLTAVTGRPQGASVILAGQAPALLGSQLKLEVPAGALLAPGDFGSFPPTGMTVVPVAVTPGQYPPDLTGGDQVAVFPAPSQSGTGNVQAAVHAAATARVIGLQPAASDSSGTMVVLLEASTTQAPVIAQAPGVVLVTLDAQGDAP